MKFKFVNEANKVNFCRKVLAWLENDFKRKGKPASHFWHNRDSISDSFDSRHGMVVLNEENELIGYMVWTPAGGTELTPVFTIDIVEVLEKYQNQGIFKKMLSEFSSKHSHVCVLKVNSLPQSIEKFKHLGWEDGRIENWEDLHLLRGPASNENKIGYFFKKIHESVPAVEALPDGHVIAVTPVCYYAVEKNPNVYPMKYFKIKIDSDGKLETPIITRHHPEGYVGVYRDKQLICQQKAKNLFKNSTSYSGINLFVLDRIEPLYPEKFMKFFQENDIQLEQTSVALKSGDNPDVVMSQRSSIEVAQEPAHKKRRYTFLTEQPLSNTDGNGKEKEEEVTKKSMGLGL